MSTTELDNICAAYHLTAFQIYVLSQNETRYDIYHLRKIGDNLYAPYRSALCDGVWDCTMRFFRGPVADIIGPEHLIVSGKRIKAISNKA